MDCKSNLFDRKSLAFFGRVNASISHELKNVMAIISETAGLLNDLSEMARKGEPIELDMLTESTGSIIEEIQRGFTTIRQMNRFSHSVDTPVVLTDLREILDLVKHLLGYLPFTGKIRIHPVDGDAPLALTCPFILQTILYEAAVRIFQEAGSEAKLDVSIRARDDASWHIFFDGFSVKKLDGLPSDDMKRMATSIGVSILCNHSADRLEIQVPVSTQAVEVCSDGIGDTGKREPGII
jgi:signal transduction histidine kinase